MPIAASALATSVDRIRLRKRLRDLKTLHGREGVPVDADRKAVSPFVLERQNRRDVPSVLQFQKVDVCRVAGRDARDFRVVDPVPGVEPGVKELLQVGDIVPILGALVARRGVVLEGLHEPVLIATIGPALLHQPAWFMGRRRLR